jgi:hypothetical protein
VTIGNWPKVFPTQIDRAQNSRIFITKFRMRDSAELLVVCIGLPKLVIGMTTLYDNNSTASIIVFEIETRIVNRELL